MSSEDSKPQKTYEAQNQINVGGNVSGGSFHAGNVNTTSYVQGGRTTTYHQDSHNVVTIENKYLSDMPESFAKSLVTFADQVSKQIEQEKIPPANVAPIKNSLNELAQATTNLKEGGLTEEKKENDS